MKLSKALLGAILVGISVQTTQSSCNKKEKEELTRPHSGNPAVPQDGEHPVDPCPGCGMG